jgi:hypothetical protein
MTEGSSIICRRYPRLPCLQMLLALALFAALPSYAQDQEIFDPLAGNTFRTA